MKTIQHLAIGALLLGACINHVCGQGDSASLKDLPDFNHGEYKAEPYLKAAINLQALGRTRASEKLLQLGQDRDKGQTVILLCRMLFAKKKNAEFRPPALGEAVFLGETAYADWPLEPIELVDGIPFLIVRGYNVEGLGEPGEYYVRYCMEKCDWSTFQFKPKTDAEKRAALTKLLSSTKWRRLPVIRGTDLHHGSPLEDEEREFISRQIE